MRYTMSLQALSAGLEQCLMFLFLHRFAWKRRCKEHGKTASWTRIGLDRIRRYHTWLDKFDQAKGRVWRIAATTGRFDTALHVNRGTRFIQALRSFEAWQSKSRLRTRHISPSVIGQHIWTLVPFKIRFSDFLQLPLARESDVTHKDRRCQPRTPNSQRHRGKAGRSHPSRPRHSHSANL